MLKQLLLLGILLQLSCFLRAGEGMASVAVAEGTAGAEAVAAESPGGSEASGKAAGESSREEAAREKARRVKKAMEGAPTGLYCVVMSLLGLSGIVLVVHFLRVAMRG